MIEPKLKTLLLKKLEFFEGRVPHLYLDTDNNVTIGVGHLVSNKAAMAALVLYLTDEKGKPQRLATISEKEQEFDTIRKIVPRSTGTNSFISSYFKQFTRLIMKDGDINRLRDQHLKNFYQELRVLYSRQRGYIGFDAFPFSAKLALFDLIYNMGATRFAGQYIRFNRHIKAQQWVKAANESARPGLSPLRNNHVKQLLLKAATESASQETGL